MKIFQNKYLLLILIGIILILVLMLVYLSFRGRKDKVNQNLQTTATVDIVPSPSPTESSVATNKQEILDKYAGREAQEWGDSTSGVIKDFTAQGKQIALTLDACPRSTDQSFDKRLIDYLAQNNIPATLFISGSWAEKNRENLDEIVKNPNFEIENHGMDHKPCSSKGESAFGVKGTENVSEIYDEIETSANLLEEFTGKKVKFYRSGTGYADEICVGVAEDIGEKVVNWSLAADGGATYSKDKIESLLDQIESGQIAIVHMNHPEGPNAEAIIESIPKLQSAGFDFVKLEDVIN